MQQHDLEHYHRELRNGLLNIALKFGQGIGRRGNLYAWMIDCRELLLTQPYLHYASRLLWERLKTYDIEVVGGLTIAANPLTIGVMYESRNDMEGVDGVIIRREPKNNGLRKQVEGPDLRGGRRLALVDDLVNSGDTQKIALDALRPFERDVAVVGVVVDYERSGAEWLRSQGIAVESLFTLAELGIAPQEPKEPGTVEVLWRKPLNSGRYVAPKSSPRIEGDRLWVGSDQGDFLCYDLAGRERWRFMVRDHGRGVHGTPAFSDGKVYFGAYDGFLYCLEGATGRLLWESRPAQWIGSSPVVYQDFLYVGIEYGESGGSLIAVDASTGKSCWELPTGNYVHATPTVDTARGQVLIGSNDGVMRAAKLETGELLWEFKTDGEIKAQAVVDKELCFFGSFDGFLYALDAASGRLVWRRQLARRLYNTPLVVKNLVLSGGHSNRLVALERESGEVRWVAATDGQLIGGAAYYASRDAVVVGSFDRKLYLLSSSDGSTISTVALERELCGVPTVSGETIYFASFGDLYALSVRPA